MEKKRVREFISEDPRGVLHLLDQEDKRKNLIKWLWYFALDEKEQKTLRKSAKKALYIIKSRGIDIESNRPRFDMKIQSKDMPEEKIVSSMLSIPDSFQNSILFFALVEGDGFTIKFYDFLIHPERGVEKYSVTKGSKKKLERIRDQGEFIILPEDYSLFRLNRALKITDRERIPGVNKLPKILELKEERDAPHPASELLPANIKRLLNPEEEKRLFERGEILRLSLPEWETEEYKDEIEEAKKSILILDNRDPRERVNDIIERFYNSYFTAENLALYREMLLDIALFFYQRKAIDQARLLFDYANRLTYTNPDIKQHPFLRFLVYKEFLM